MNSSGHGGGDQRRPKSQTRQAWMSAATAAHYIDVSAGTIINLAKRGELRAYPVLGTTLKRYRRSELDALLESGFEDGRADSIDDPVAGSSSDSSRRNRSA